MCWAVGYSGSQEGQGPCPHGRSSVSRAKGTDEQQCRRNTRSQIRGAGKDSGLLVCLSIVGGARRAVVS